MQGSLLWVYEGQTQYWGNVITARAGLRNFETAKDALALVAATYAENRAGLSWRALQDTTNDPIIAKRTSKAYGSWQLSEDYYSGGQMIWLEVDARLREKSNNKVSLDDFAKKFFGMNDGDFKVNPYTFEDVAATLNGLVADDWATFLHDRLDGKVPLTGGIEASGWKLVFKDKPNAYAKAAAAEYGRGGARLRVFARHLGRRRRHDQQRALGQPGVQGRHRPRHDGDGGQRQAVQQRSAGRRDQGGEDRQEADRTAGEGVRPVSHDPAAVLRRACAIRTWSGSKASRIGCRRSTRRRSNAHHSAKQNQKSRPAKRRLFLATNDARRRRTQPPASSTSPTIPPRAPSHHADARP